MRRPVDAYAPEVFETHFDSTIALIQRGVEFRLQTRDSGTVDEIPGATRQHRQPFFRRREIAGQELALGPLELERERERVPLLPTVLCQQRASGDKVCQGRRIGRRSFGPLSGNEIELGNLVALLL